MVFGRYKKFGAKCRTDKFLGTLIPLINNLDRNIWNVNRRPK